MGSPDAYARSLITSFNVIAIIVQELRWFWHATHPATFLAQYAYRPAPGEWRVLVASYRQTDAPNDLICESSNDDQTAQSKRRQVRIDECCENDRDVNAKRFSLIQLMKACRE